MDDRADPRPALARWAACFLVWLLAACGGGPGTGGTGTGPEAALTQVYGTPATSTPTAATAPNQGGVCASPCGRAELRLQESLVELSVPCARFTSAGPWNTQAAQAELAGFFTTTGPGAATQPATLRLQFNALPGNADRVTATLLDVQGRTLSGPVELVRDAAGAGTPSCP